VRLMAPFMPFLAEEMYQNLVRSIDPNAPESVHHTPFPEVQPTLVDDRLLAQMAVIRQAASLGHSIRKQTGINLRRPLGVARVSASPEYADISLALWDELADEINVKRVEFVNDLSEAVRHRVETNPKLLGPKYGKAYPSIRQALQAGQFQVLEEDAVEVTAAGQTVRLEPEEVTVTLEPVPGYAAAVERGTLVLLDTSQTPELLAEGRAREIVRLIQEARKNANFDVADRILVEYDAPSDLRGAIEMHRAYIARETLALSVEPHANPGGGNGHPARGEIDDLEVALSVRRAPRQPT
jgi:isoleucyl-tRNA synthetase